MSWFNYFPAFLGKVLLRVESFASIIVILAVIFVEPVQTIGPVPYFVVVLLLFEASYATYRDERAMRAEREKLLLIRPKISQMILKTGNRYSLNCTIILELTPRGNVATDTLRLNVIKVRQRPRWQVWGLRRRKETKLFGIPPNGQDDFTFRQKYDESMLLPISETVTFKVEREIEDYRKKDMFDLEIGLETLIPGDIFYARLRSDLGFRGTTPAI